MSCPFCGLDPYEYVDVGVGGRGVPVAVNCCEFGPMLFDDRSSDKKWLKLAEAALEELGDTPYNQERMNKAADIVNRLMSAASTRTAGKERE